MAAPFEQFYVSKRMVSGTIIKKSGSALFSGVWPGAGQFLKSKFKLSYLIKKKRES
jgi:hypothetical protein